MQVDVVEDPRIDGLDDKRGGRMCGEPYKPDPALLLVLLHHLQAAARLKDPVQVLRAIYAVEPEKVKVSPQQREGAVQRAPELVRVGHGPDLGLKYV